MTARVRKVERTEMTLLERFYVFAVFRGMLTTHGRFRRNWFRRKDTQNPECPEQRRKYPGRWRGLPRLMYRDDGSVRCVACMLCSTHCPANCITIVAGEHEDPTIETYPLSFEIDLLKCIYCGMCEEACPCDAIRLDTGLHAPPVRRREDAVIGMEELLSRTGPPG